MRAYHPVRYLNSFSLRFSLCPLRRETQRSQHVLASDAHARSMPLPGVPKAQPNGVCASGIVVVSSPFNVTEVRSFHAYILGT